MNLSWLEGEGNHGLRVIAVLMAVTLWIFVGLLPRIDNDKRKMMVEIKVKNPPGAQALRTSPAVAEVLLEGPKGAISQLNDQDLEVFVDVKGRWHGSTDAYPLHISGPPGVRWELTPSTVKVHRP